MVIVAKNSDSIPLDITDVLEQVLVVLLPKGLVIVLEQAVFDHLFLVFLD